MIKLINISKRYGEGDQAVHAVRNINLEVAAGQIMGVIGESGAGKSSLIRCVNMLERPSSGKVLVDGQDLTQLNNSELPAARRNIGMIFQHFNLLASRTVFANVALPLELAGMKKAAITQRVNELLELVGLTHRAYAYPKALSGGQKQRVAIARALAPNPKVLLCDEATSALDPHTTQAILALLKDINRQLGLTILLITHEMQVVKSICDRVAIINQGELIEQGDVAWFFTNAKTELAQRFIASTIHLAIPEDYQQRLVPEPIADAPPLVRLGFSGETVDSPLISILSRELNVDVSILSADMEYAGGVKFGFMLAELEGTRAQTQAALAYLSDHKIQVEVLGYVRRHD